MNSADLDVTMQTEEVYDPPADFRANAEYNDEAVYALADADPSGWCASCAEKLTCSDP